MFFFILENIYFQSHERYQLSNDIRKLALHFFHAKLMKSVIIQEISYD